MQSLIIFFTMVVLGLILQGDLIPAFLIIFFIMFGHYIIGLLRRLLTTAFTI